MTPNGFKPAESLEEANERLRRVEHALAVERDRVRRMTPAATPEQEEEMRRELATPGRVGPEAFDRLLAELEAECGHH